MVAQTMRRAYLPLLLLTSGVCLWSVLSGKYLAALPYGSGTYDTCTYDTCNISLLTSGTVTLNVTPTASGVNTTAKDEATVSTDASTGYTLTFRDVDTVTDLENGAETIPTSGGTPASPVTLALNTWGY